MADRWLAADVELVARALWRGISAPPSSEFAAARRVLSALSAAGRLLPPGGESGTSWAVLDLGEGTLHRWPESDARQLAAEHGWKLLRSALTEWPDGTVLLGPWQPVEPTTVGPPSDTDE